MRGFNYKIKLSYGLGDGDMLKVDNLKYFNDTILEK